MWSKRVAGFEVKPVPLGPPQHYYGSAPSTVPPALQRVGATAVSTTAQPTTAKIIAVPSTSTTSDASKRDDGTWGAREHGNRKNSPLPNSLLCVGCLASEAGSNSKSMGAHPVESKCQENIPAVLCSGGLGLLSSIVLVVVVCCCSCLSGGLLARRQEETCGIVGRGHPRSDP
eukprot:5530473-Amphidinium_carterae.1